MLQIVIPISFEWENNFGFVYMYKCFVYMQNFISSVNMANDNTKLSTYHNNAYDVSWA